MKSIYSYILFIFIVSCTSSADNQNVDVKSETSSDIVLSESIIKNDSSTINKRKTVLVQDPDSILRDGTYRFDIAFAEWDGKSMGEKVTVVIKGKMIKVIYEGDGGLTLSKKGDILDEGEIMKHKSGIWIIGKNSADSQTDEIGGCSGGPSIIDFKERKFWMC